METFNGVSFGGMRYLLRQSCRSTLMLPVLWVLAFISMASRRVAGTVAV